MESPAVATISHADLLRELSQSRRKKKVETQSRKCLRCDEMFGSVSVFERICYKCKNRGDWDKGTYASWAERGGL